ncbi:MAG: polysaccharide deacetylase family protein [Clostridia bacterium]|nr:polysaccharide deacetylase family protein [Clostridia bacterium]
MRYFIITKRHITVALSLILGFTVITVSIFSYQALAASSKRLLPIYCVEDKGEKTVALSFDAAWGNEDTGELISILGKYKIKATFFVVGSWVDKYPESVKQLSDAGHEIHNHSNSHPHMPQLSVSQMTDELNACNEKISAITGKKPILFRAPYGDYNNTMLETVTNNGMYTIQWDIDSRDWKEEYTTDMIVKGVSDNVKSGSIVLFHNAAKNTPKALPIILERLIADGYSFKLISEMIYKDNYEIIHDGTQVKKDG